MATTITHHHQTVTQDGQRPWATLDTTYYYGGDENGVCLQISIDAGTNDSRTFYATKDQALEIAAKILEAFDTDQPRADESNEFDQTWDAWQDALAEYDEQR